MKSTQIITTIILLSGMLIWTGCSKDGKATTSSSSSAISSIASLPASTGEVVSSALMAKPMIEALATTGETFATAGSNAWTSSHSRCFCESIGLSRDLFAEASQPDQIMCYMGVMNDKGMFSNSTYDGTYHYFELTNMSDGPPSTPVIKVKVDKNSDGRISSFEMFMCFGATVGVQTGYIKMTIATDGTTTNITKWIDTFGVMSFSTDVTATGKINSSGDWTSKQIVANRFFNDGSSNDSGMSVTLTQTSTDITLSGSFEGNFGTQSFNDQYYAVTQILNASKMSTLAFGDGSCKFNITYTDSSDASNDYTSGNITESWLGDTRAIVTPATDGAKYAAADAGTMPAVVTVTAVTFDADQTWDCAAGTGGFTTLDFSTAAGIAAETSMDTLCENVDNDSRINCGAVK